MSNIDRIAFLFLLWGTGLSGISHADIYAYTAENGVSHFSNIPSDKSYQLYLKTPDTQHRPANTSKNIARRIHSAKSGRFESYIEDAARIYQVDSALLHAVITAESNYNAAALSRKGAIGLMQLMPLTAKRFGVIDPYDPGQNIRGGAQYLKYLLGLFNNDLNLVLAAYNAGENAVRRYGNRLPPYQETMRYVPKVLGYYQKYRES